MGFGGGVGGVGLGGRLLRWEGVLLSCRGFEEGLLGGRDRLLLWGLGITWLVVVVVVLDREARGGGVMAGCAWMVLSCVCW